MVAETYSSVLGTQLLQALLIENFRGIILPVERGFLPELGGVIKEVKV